MINNTDKLPDRFSTPTAEPANCEQQLDWQQRNQSWWQSNPMRYDWRDPIPGAEFTAEFYEEIDRRHFCDAAHYSPPQEKPFDELIPFAALPHSDVLEIGIGNGSHAKLIAPHCRSYVGIDITRYAVESTTRRFEIFGLPGRILQMDAERMEFSDASFDFIWTWGVIHHSSNTERVLQEMRRVLRPGGRAVVMVYHRSLLYYYVSNGLFRGIIGGDLLKTRSLHKTVQLHTDGAIARFYSVSEWRALAQKYFAIESVRIKGQKSEILPIPSSRLKDTLAAITPGILCRFVLTVLAQGSFLISQVQRP